MRNSSSCLTALAAVLILAAPASAEIIVVLDHLVEPPVYDNLGGGNTWPVAGQTFLATSEYFAGVRLWIGDPSRPDLPSVGTLTGPADLVIFEAQKLEQPVELARTRVVEPGEEVRGELDFMMDCAVPTHPGQKYFFAISAEDAYGLGLRSVYSSTYPDGAETFFRDGLIEEHPFGRDASFAIYGDTAFDLDADGFAECEGDCNDVDPAVYPGAPELPGNLVDENCDGSLGDCDPRIEWRNHGQFVRCVAHECADLVLAGDLTEAECDVLVSRAAQSDVGRK